MKDRFDNDLHPGCTVIYFSTSFNQTPHIGTYLEEVPGKGSKLLSEKKREIYRNASSLIVYTGNVP
jgi:hypothetical protein